MDGSLLESESIFVKIPNGTPGSPNYPDSIEELHDELKSLSWDQFISLDLEQSASKSVNESTQSKVRMTKSEALKLLNIAATLLQRNIRRYFQQKKYRLFLMVYKAAVRIQSTWRGYRTRNLDVKLLHKKHAYIISKLQEHTFVMNKEYRQKIDCIDKDKQLMVQLILLLSNEVEKLKDSSLQYKFTEIDLVSSVDKKESDPATPTNDQTEFYANNRHLIQTDSGVHLNLEIADNNSKDSGSISDPSNIDHPMLSTLPRCNDVDDNRDVEKGTTDKCVSISINSEHTQNSTLSSNVVVGGDHQLEPSHTFSFSNNKITNDNAIADNYETNDTMKSAVHDEGRKDDLSNQSLPSTLHVTNGSCSPGENDKINTPVEKIIQSVLPSSIAEEKDVSQQSQTICSTEIENTCNNADAGNSRNTLNLISSSDVAVQGQLNSVKEINVVNVDDISLYENTEDRTLNENSVNKDNSKESIVVDFMMEADSVEFMNDSLQVDDANECANWENLENSENKIASPFLCDSFQMESHPINPIQADSLQFIQDSLQVD